MHDTEGAIYDELRHDMPAVGEDVKVMGKRDGDTLDLAVAVATVARHVDDVDAYISVMGEVEEFVRGVASERFDGEVNVAVNTADDRETGSVYLTETGTSAEMGDDGSVGRGNRANGLITPSREMSLEAASGKNPFNHIGKLYNLLADELSNDVYEEVEAVEEASVKILSQIGSPIDQPQVAAVNVHTADGVSAEEVEYDVESVIDDGLEDVTSITQRIINGELSTF